MSRPEPLVSRLRYASKVVQIRSQYLHPDYYRPFRVIQGNAITVGLFLRAKAEKLQ